MNAIKYIVICITILIAVALLSVGIISNAYALGRGTGVFNNISAYGTLDMTDNLINNVADPVSAQDAATKSYVDAGDTPVYFAPYSLSVQNGTLAQGNYTSVADKDSGILIINETVTNPGFDVTFYYKDITTFNSLRSYIQYQGSVSHMVHMDIAYQNFTTWEEYASIESDGYKWYDPTVPDPDEHIDGGEVRVRIYHDGQGIGTHVLRVKEMRLSSSSGGGSTVAYATKAELAAHETVFENHSANVGSRLSTNRQQVFNSAFPALNTLLTNISGLSRDVNVLTVGNSHTTGIGMTNRLTENWTFGLATSVANLYPNTEFKYYSQANIQGNFSGFNPVTTIQAGTYGTVNFWNAGLGGTNPADLLSQTAWDLMVTPADPDAVIICYSYNNQTQNIDLQVDEIVRLLEKFYEDYPHAELLLLTEVPNNNLSGANIDTNVRAVRRAASLTGTHVADTFQHFTSGAQQTGTNHPTLSGHRTITNVLRKHFLTVDGYDTTPITNTRVRDWAIRDLTGSQTYDYYVATDGDDETGIGVSGREWATPQRAVDKVPANYNSDYDIYLEKGTYTGQLVFGTKNAGGDYSVNIFGDYTVVQSVTIDSATNTTLTASGAFDSLSSLVGSYAWCTAGTYTSVYEMGPLLNQPENKQYAWVKTNTTSVVTFAGYMPTALSAGSTVEFRKPLTILDGDGDTVVENYGTQNIRFFNVKFTNIGTGKCVHNFSNFPMMLQACELDAGASTGQCARGESKSVNLWGCLGYGGQRGLTANGQFFNSWLRDMSADGLFNNLGSQWIFGDNSLISGCGDDGIDIQFGGQVTFVGTGSRNYIENCTDKAGDITTTGVVKGTTGLNMTGNGTDSIVTDSNSWAF